MKDLKGKLAIDTSALIELIYCDRLGQKLKQALKTDMVEAYTTELAITELRYVLCRKLEWQQSKERVNKLLASGYFKVEDTSQLINEAAKIKCQRAISLPDCFILALAHKIAGNALFARQEQELADEMAKNSFGITLLFLEKLDRQNRA
jgi:predicted nucleic acid-binding protein